MLVKKKDDPKETLYAMKTLRKAALLKRNQIAHTATERTILQNIHCPFLVHLVYAFQTPDKLCEANLYQHIHINFCIDIWC